MTTIYEVATRAGVSPATVSRVLNGVKVDPVLAEKVRIAVADLDFVPNRTARTLRKRDSTVIVLIVPDIENPFFTSLARGVEDFAQDAGYSLILCNTDEKVDKEARYINIALSEHAAGIILAPASEHSDLAPLLALGNRVVAVDRIPNGFEVDAVTVDNRERGNSAATALFDQGFTRVACITGPRDVGTAFLRGMGWRDAYGGRVDSAELNTLLRYSDYRIDGGESAMLELMALPNPPDAVVVANNLMGVGALRALETLGTPPPAFGFAVVGNLPFASFHPGITVIALPARRLGSAAAEILFERIAGDKRPARTLVVPTDDPA